MRSLLALFALGVLGFGVAACGGSSSPSNSAENGTPAARVSSAHPPDTTSPAKASPSAVSGPVHNPTRGDREKYDRDEDDYIHVPDDHNPSPPGYVTAAAPEAKQVEALVRAYYADALAENGAKGCSLIDASFVKAIPLDYGKLGPAYLRRAASTCPAVMSLLFEHEHHLLAHELPEMRIVRVSVKGTQGVAFLLFGRLHERFISVLREGATWRIASVLDGELE